MDGKKENIQKPQNKRMRKKAKKIIGQPTVPKTRKFKGGKKTKEESQSVYSAETDSQSILVPTQQPAITIAVPILPQQVYGVCASYVSYALGRGWLSRAGLDSYPYWAAQYMYTVLTAYISSSQIKAGSLPLWLQKFGQALAPKTVRCMQGFAAYKFDNAAILNYVNPPEANLNVSVYGYNYLLYPQKLTGSVNGFPIAEPPVAYTDDNGRDAWTSLSQFMAQLGNPESLVTPIKPNTWSKNVSAFAMPANAEGTGVGNSGGQIFQAGLEVPIYTPCLGVFANVLASGAINPARYGVFSTSFAGDAAFASWLFYNSPHAECKSMLKVPRLHSVDFLEFADVVALWCQKLLENASSLAANAPSTVVQCPLSIQEMQLLLKNELMFMFGNTQPSVQFIYPRLPQTGSDNEFVPFPCGTNVVALSSCGMRLPLVLVENMKALRGRWVHSKSQSPTYFCPILGKYYLDTLNTNDYIYKKEGIDTPVFFEGAAFSRNLATSKGVKKESLIELPIDLIDGSSGSDYVFINDQTRLRTLAAFWNEWLQNLSSVSMTLTEVSIDQGVNICTGIGQTLHWIPEPPTAIQRRTEIVDERVLARRGLSATPYSSRSTVALSSHDKIYAPVYTQLSNFWVLPQNKAVAGTGLANQSVFQRQQIIAGEAFSVSLSGQDDGYSISARHNYYASTMVRGITAHASQIEEFFLDMSRKGEGGILSGLVAGWIGKTFGATAGSIAGTVAEVLPL